MADRVYYAIPGFYTIGEEFETLDQAAVAAARRIVLADRENRDRGSFIPLREHIDVRHANDHGDRVLKRFVLTLSEVDYERS